METCPCCERDLIKMSDYPLVVIKTVERTKLPNEIFLPQMYCDIIEEEEFKKDDEDYDIISYFNQNKDKDTFVKNDVLWEKITNESFVNKGLIQSLTKHFGFKDDKLYFYKRREDQTKKVIEGIESYLTTLESYIGKEVKPKEIIYPFITEVNSRTNLIPKTDYGLVYNFQTGRSNKENIFEIFVDSEEAFDLGIKVIPSVSFKIAKLEYEGKLKR